MGHLTHFLLFPREVGGMLAALNLPSSRALPGSDAGKVVGLGTTRDVGGQPEPQGMTGPAQPEPPLRAFPGSRVPAAHFPQASLLILATPEGCRVSHPPAPRRKISSPGGIRTHLDNAAERETDALPLG